LAGGITQKLIKLTLKWADALAQKNNPLKINKVLGSKRRKTTTNQLS
jgi:hypothetical protein